MKKIKQLVSSLLQGIKEWWTNFGTARKVILIIGTIMYGIVSKTNQIAEFYDRFIGGENRSPKEQLRVISTNETGFVSTKPFEILAPTNTTDKTTGDTNSLHFIVKKMAAAHQRGAYDDAVHFATTAETLLSQCDNHDPSVISDHVAIKSCLMEESFYRGDYDRTIELHKEMQTLGDGRYVATRPRFMALESAAALLKSGGTIFFFSPHDLGELKKWDKTMLEEYLSFLAAWGYLQPVMIDPWQKRQTTFYYEEFFGFSKPLPYQRSYMLTINLTNGVELASNEMSARWAGRKRFIPIDLDKCAIDELNLSGGEIFRKPLKMSLRFNEDQPQKVCVEWSQEDSLGLAPETPISIKARTEWNPKMRENLKPHHIGTIATVRHRNSAATRIPPEIFVIIVVLISMAFASPTHAPENDKPDGSNDKTDNSKPVCPAQDEPQSKQPDTKDFLPRLWSRLRKTKLSVVVEVAILFLCLFLIACLRFLDTELKWVKVCYDICLNISAAAIFALIIENITMRMSKRETAAKILRADACIRNFISQFCKLYLELTYEDKNQFIADVKTIDFTKRGGVDSILTRRINGRAMASIFLPSMMIGNGYKRSAIVAFIEAEKSMISAFLQMSQAIDFFYWPEIFNALQIIIHCSSVINCQTEMTELAKTFQEGNTYGKILKDMLTNGTFDNIIAKGNIPTGNILTPYVIFYRHTEWLVATLCDYENKLDIIRNRFPDLVIP